MSQNTQAAVATKSKFSVRDICYAGLFAAVIAVMAQISIPMPLGCLLYTSPSPRD